MLLNIIFKMNDDIIKTYNETFTTAKFNTTVTYEFTLKSGVITWSISNSFVNETLSGSYDFTQHKNDAVALTEFTASDLQWTLTNGNSFTGTQNWAEGLEEATIICVITPKGYSGDPIASITKRIDNICKAVKTVYKRPDIKINANYIDDFLLNTPNSLQQLAVERGNLNKFCFEWRANSYDALKFLNGINFKQASQMFGNSDIAKFNNIVDFSNYQNAINLFNGCTNLKNATVNVKSCPAIYGMFSGCTSLTLVELLSWGPSSESNASSMFYNCSKLNKIIIREFDTYHLGTSSFYATPFLLGTATDYIYVPSKDVEQVKQAANWVTVAKYIRGIVVLDKLGPGTIVQDTVNGECIVQAIPDEGNIFDGWYKGYVETIRYLDPNTVTHATITDKEGQTYKFTLRDDGFYESNNKGVASSTAYGLFNFTVPDDNAVVIVTYINNGESGYDYGSYYLYKASDLNTALKKTEKMEDSTSTKTVEFILEPGDYTLEVRFRKDSSSNQGNDSLRIKVDIGTTVVEQTIDGELYSESATLNLGVVDEKTIDPVGYVAKFTTSS